MFVRLARYDVPNHRIEEAVEAFEEAARELEGTDGLQGGYVLRDTESGGIVTLTLWDSRQSMDTSETRAAGLRKEAMQRVDGNVASVQTLDVEVEIGATRPAAV